MNNNTILWEENDSIEPLKRLENKQTLDLNDGTNVIKNVFAKNECDDTGEKKRWKKICPNCHREVFYSSEYHLKDSIKPEIIETMTGDYKIVYNDGPLSCSVANGMTLHYKTKDGKEDSIYLPPGYSLVPYLEPSGSCEIHLGI